MTGHNRREGYWQYYETAKEVEQSHLKEMLIDIIQEIPCPREKKDGGAGPRFIPSKSWTLPAW